MNEKLKIIFAGTPDFAVPALLALASDADFEVAAVITQEDKPVGRKQILTPPPVKTAALEKGLKVWQPNKIKTAQNDIAALAPDFLIVVAYGKIIPKSILNIPKYGCVNGHASLLPRYRGAAVIQAPILNGDKETGVTIMEMDEGLDTGPILRQEKIVLAEDETAETLHDKLAALTAALLPPALKELAAGQIAAQPQDDSQSTYVKELSKEDGKIDWTKSAAEIERMIRAFTPWPGTFAIINYQLSIINKKVKITSAENNVLPINKYKIGEIFLADGKLAVQCGRDALIITELQLEGGRPMSAGDFLRGHADFPGKILA